METSDAEGRRNKARRRKEDVINVKIKKTRKLSRLYDITKTIYVGQKIKI
jgi:hypothetical protein